MKTTVLEGDITSVARVEAIITLINSAGIWYGGIDMAIKRVAGNQYHIQAAQELERVSARDGVALVANKRFAHGGQFENVIFMIDNFELEICDLVYLSLRAAEAEKYSSVAMPVMRTGLMDQLSGLSLSQTAEQIKAGITRFRQEFPESTMEVLVVVYRNPEMSRLLSQVLAF